MPANVTHEMNVAPSYGMDHVNSYEYSLSTVAEGSSEVVLIPRDVKVVTVTAIPAGGATVTVLTTCSSIAEVKAGTETWTDWSYGAVSNPKSGSCDPVTAMKIVQTGTGSAKLVMRAQ